MKDRLQELNEIFSNQLVNEWSDYIIYVDESGDHSLTHANKEYPIFVLV